MSWWDDIFGSADTPSIDVSSPDTSTYDWLNSLPDTSAIDLGNLVPDASSVDDTSWLSGSDLVTPTTSNFDWLNSIPTDAATTPDSVGMDTLVSQLQDNTYDPTQSMAMDPVATSQLWEKLNLSPNMSIDPSTTGGSTAALLTQLTNNTPAATDTTNGQWGAYGYSDGATHSAAPDYMGTGSKSFNDYYNPTDGVVPTNAGIPQENTNSFAKVMAQLLAKPAINGIAGKKSNLSNAIGTLGGLAQVYGALSSGNSKAAPSVAQHGTTSMTWNKSVAKKKAAGGAIRGNQVSPRGALGLLKGVSTGQQDDVPINASHGEYVVDADVVSALGDGNTEAGAAKLDKMRQNVRTHKRAAPAHKIPPKAKQVSAYMPGVK